VRGYVGPRQSVLVVDDARDSANARQDLLTPLGFEVQTPPSGYDCLRAAERDKPNLIILDIRDARDGRLGDRATLRRVLPERTAIVVISANAIDSSRLTEASACTTTT
jgi:CheY-like chemotaxis protein